MREIKFRGRGLFDTEWIYGGYFILRGETKIACEEYKGPNGKLIYWTVDPATVGQYTGLHDAKGVEIYEGDVLRAESGKIYEVIFGQGAYRIKHRTCKLLLVDGWYYEVIGNVHDAPELLKK